MTTFGIYNFLEQMVVKHNRVMNKDLFLAELCAYFDIVSKGAIKDKLDFMKRQELISPTRTGFQINYMRRRNV